MMDANQVWDVDEAIAAMRALGEFDPWWIEEPTSPDDVLGHARIRREIAPIRVATGEHVQNRVIFKQLLPGRGDRRLPDRRLPDRRRQRGARGPPAGGEVRRSRSVRTPAASACASTSSTSRSSTTSRVSGSLEDRVVEWVDHLHEHFRDPAVVARRPLPSSRWRPATASRCCPRRSTSTSSRTGPVWSRGRGRWSGGA